MLLTFDLILLCRGNKFLMISPVKKILKLFIFTWRITVSLYYIAFCHISSWITHRYMHIPSLWNLLSTSHSIPPLQVVTEHPIWAPWVIQQISTSYLILRMVMCIFQVTLSILPALSFPCCVYMSVLYVCISIAAL